MAIKLNRTFSVPPNEDDARRQLVCASPEWLGGFGEELWKRVLASSGWTYIPLCQIENGGAPLARGEETAFVLPDFDAAKDGFSVYVDAKVKSQSIIYRKKNQERHGINEACWNAYRLAGITSSKDCALAILELHSERSLGRVEWSGSLLFETLKNLGSPRCEHPEKPPKVYWPRKAFRDLDSFTALELFQLVTGDIRREYQLELDSVLRPVKQRNLFV